MFFKKVAKGISGAIDAMNSTQYEINGVKVKCINCGHYDFEKGSALLNTVGLTFINLDWANRSATVLACKSCSYIMWFAKAPEKIV